MKVIGINSSARKNGNTAILIGKVFEDTVLKQSLYSFPDRS